MKRNEIKTIVRDLLLETLNQEEHGGQSDEEYQYANGKKWGVKDRLSDTERDLSHYPPAFVKGYKEVQREDWWSKFNERLTQLIANLGSSLRNR